MSAEHQTPQRNPKRFADLALDSFKLYKSGLLPLTAAALIGCLGSFFLALLADPNSGIYTSFFLFIADAIPVGLAEIAILILAIRLQQGDEPGILSSYLAGVPIAPYYLFGNVVASIFFLSSMLVAFSLFGPSLILIPFLAIGLFFFARFGFWGPIIVSERRGFFSALRISWIMVKGRTPRTMAIWAGIYLSLLIFMLLVLVPIISVFPAFQLFIIFLFQALTLPFLTIFTLLLYQDYLGVVGGPQSDLLAIYSMSGSYSDESYPPPEDGNIQGQ